MSEQQNSMLTRREGHVIHERLCRLKETQRAHDDGKRSHPCLVKLDDSLKISYPGWEQPEDVKQAERFHSITERRDNGFNNGASKTLVDACKGKQHQRLFEGNRSRPPQPTNAGSSAIWRPCCWMGGRTTKIKKRPSNATTD
jgi:hypothetical protein